MTEIRSNMILPARGEQAPLHTADGLGLVAELAIPADRPPIASLLTLHPLPTHGGMMDSHLFRKAAWRLPALAGLAVLRFNTRGTASTAGRSGGEVDSAGGERYDVAAAIEYAEDHDLPRRWLGGWSFGTDLALMYGADASIEGGILVSPPWRHARDEHLDTWARFGKPMLVLVPEFDDYLRPAEAKERFAGIPQAEVVGVDGAKHLWVGERFVRRACGEIVGRGAPEVETPLPTQWTGPYETWSDLCRLRTGKAALGHRSSCCTPSRCPRRCGNT